MSWQSHTVAVWRRYDNRQRDYRWIAATPRGEVAGWEEILDHQAHEGWELVAASAHLGGTITRGPLDQIDSFFPDADDRNTTRKQLAQSHFWCDLFAALAAELKHCKEALDSYRGWSLTSYSAPPRVRCGTN